jgi:hypothetical protein
MRAGPAAATAGRGSYESRKAVFGAVLLWAAVKMLRGGSGWRSALSAASTLRGAKNVPSCRR